MSTKDGYDGKAEQKQAGGKDKKAGQPHDDRRPDEDRVEDQAHKHDEKDQADKSAQPSGKVASSTVGKSVASAEVNQFIYAWFSEQPLFKKDLTAGKTVLDDPCPVASPDEEHQMARNIRSSNL